MQIEEKLITLADDMRIIKGQLKGTLYALTFLILFQFAMLAWILVR